MKNIFIQIKLLNVLLLILVFTFLSCNSRHPQKNNTVQIKTSITKPTLKFYIEDGGSMEGFFVSSNSGFCNSVSSIYRIISKNSKKDTLCLIQNKNLDTKFFYKNQVDTISNIRNHYRKDKIGGSNLYKMIQKCLNETNNNTVTALVSDFIYSDSANPNFSQSLAQLLDFKGVDVCLVKLNSKFEGKYFYEKKTIKKPIMIDCLRPYYIWFFGSKENFKKLKITDDSTYKKITDFENVAFYSQIQNDLIEYTILPNTNNEGRFDINRKLFSKNKIKGIQNVITGRNENNFQFSLAIDFNNSGLSEKYLLDTSNYEFQKGNYKIVEINKLDKLNFGQNIINQSDYKYLKNQNYTHIITIQSTSNIPNDVELILKKQIPLWLKNSSSSNEQNIGSSKSEKTYNFSNFLTAIDVVYIFQKNEYIKIKLKIDQGSENSKSGLFLVIIIVLIIIGFVIYKKMKK